MWILLDDREMEHYENEIKIASDNIQKALQQWTNQESTRFEMEEFSIVSYFSGLTINNNEDLFYFLGLLTKIYDKTGWTIELEDLFDNYYPKSYIQYLSEDEDKSYTEVRMETWFRVIEWNWALTFDEWVKDSKK